MAGCDEGHPSPMGMGRDQTGLGLFIWVSNINNTVNNIVTVSLKNSSVPGHFCFDTGTYSCSIHFNVICVRGACFSIPKRRLSYCTVDRAIRLILMNFKRLTFR